MRPLLFLFLAALVSAEASPTTDGALPVQPVAGPAVRQLSGGWEFYQGSLAGPWEVWRGSAAVDNVAWSSVTLPHCFNARDSVDPDAPYYQGPGWYRTRLKIANPHPGGRTLLHFNGAGQKADVFIGLDKVAEHLGGYDEWTVDITDAAAAVAAKPENRDGVPLAVRCDNSRSNESIPSDMSDFSRYGGLYRHVSLVYVPAVSLERVHVEPVLAADGSATIKVRGRLLNPTAATAPVAVTVEIRDPAGQLVQTTTQSLAPWADERELAVLALPHPRLWSPDTPALYRCLVTLQSADGDHQAAARFGVRSVEWLDHGPFRLNGERLLLRGTHYHEDHAGVGAAVPDAVVRRTLQSIKDMGANFVRLSHYQQAPLVLELCDELGLLVWEEIPWCRGGLGGERYQQQARDMLRHMIDQHYNHPSVILWGLGNENDWPGDFPVFDQAAIRAFMAELNATAHRLDPARSTCIRRCDFCKDLVDVYSPSIWSGWYSNRYTDYRATLGKAAATVRHLFHAEFGGDSHAGRHAEEPEKPLEAAGPGGKPRTGKDGDWSESYIVNLFDWYLKEQAQMPDLTGAAQWVFKDFATPLRPENPVPRVNQKGVVERDGTPKESYYLFQSYWAASPMIHIYGHNWPVRWGRPDEPRQVKVFSNCDTVELFLNGASLGVRQRDITDFPAAGLRWEVRFRAGPNELRAVGRRNGVELSDAIPVDYQTAVWGRPARLALAEIARSDGAVTIEVRAFDAAGVPCLDAANQVRFGLTGDGRLLDNLGTPRGSRVVQLANGRARISLQLSGREAVASVAGNGLPTAFLHLAAAP